MKRSDFNERVAKAAQRGRVRSGALGCIELAYGQSKFVMTCYDDGFDWRFESERRLYDIRVVYDWIEIASPFVASSVRLFVEDNDLVMESNGQTTYLFTGRFYGFTTLEDTE